MMGFANRAGAGAFAAFLAVAVGFASVASAQNVDKVLSAEKSRTAEAKKSQDRVDKLADEKRTLLQQYRGVLKEIEGLEIYNQQLSRQIKAQEQEIADLDDSIDRATEFDRQVLPLMLRMIGALEQFVKLDVPFLQEERNERIEFLGSMVDRADVTVAEKFRRVLEAYQVEGEYGRTIEAYTDTLDVAGKGREVDVLRIGRIGLFYQTLDQSHQGAWNVREKKWVDLPGTYARPISNGLRMARKQAAPDLLTLPVAVPEEAK